jgi:hypothetical protein
MVVGNVLDEADLGKKKQGVDDQGSVRVWLVY